MGRAQPGTCSPGALQTWPGDPCVRKSPRKEVIKSLHARSVVRALKSYGVNPGASLSGFFPHIGVMGLHGSARPGLDFPICIPLEKHHFATRSRLVAGRKNPISRALSSVSA